MAIELKYEDYDEYDDYDYNVEDEGYDEELGAEFARDMFNALYEFVDDPVSIYEEFTSPKNWRDHYKNHCLCALPKRKSKRTLVYYDFNDPSQYAEYEKKISEEINSTEYRIGTLYEYDTIIRYMQKLFEGDITVVFCNGCGLRNSNGLVNLSIHAFSSDVTKNYAAGNTVDICVKSGRNRTITLYPVDANYLQTKLNNIIKKYSDRLDIPEYMFNND